MRITNLLSSKNKIIALIDIDSTLLINTENNYDYDALNSFSSIEEAITAMQNWMTTPTRNGESILNEALLEGLKLAGIKDLNLFTDLTLFKNNLIERIALKNVLEEKGYIVHHIITPADRAWHVNQDTLKAFTNKLDNLTHLERKMSSDIETEIAEARDQLLKLSQDADYLKIIRELNEKKNKSHPGVAFSEILEILNNKNNVSDIEFDMQIANTDEKSCRTKLFIDFVSFLNEIEHEKGEMFKDFLENNLNQKSEFSDKSPYHACIICDDNEEVLKTVNKVNQNHLVPMPLTTVYVNNNGKKKQVGEQIKKAEDYAKEMRAAKRVHPELPTIAEVKANPDVAYSDHLPILATIPLPEPLNIISLNVNAFENSSDFPSQTHKKNHDTERYKRIVESLVKLIRWHQVDIITLQGTDIDFLENIIKTHLGASWKIVTDKMTGLMTCYNQERFVFDEFCTELSILSPINSHVLSLNDKNNNHKSIMIHNIWGISNEGPHELQEFYTCAFRLIDQKIYSILIGDFNINVPFNPSIPLNNSDQHYKNNVTSTPPIHLHANEQKLNFSSGCFIQNQEVNETIQQIEVKPLSFTKKAIVKTTLNPQECSDFASQPAYQKYAVTLDLDTEVRNLKIINNQTLSEYTESLRKNCNEPDIVACRAVNAINHQKICISFTANSKAYDFIFTQLGYNPDFQFQQIDNNRNILVSIEQVENLNAVIQKYQCIVALQNYIELRKSDHGLSRFLNNCARLDEQVKVRTAEKLIGYFYGHFTEDFTPLELKAASERRLGNLIKQFKANKSVQLPKRLNDDPIDALDCYIEKRIAEKGISAFFRNLKHYDGQFKTRVAQNLKLALSGVNIDFTDDELGALLEEKSELAKIVIKYIDKMPEAIKDRHAQQSESNPSHLLLKKF